MNTFSNNKSEGLFDRLADGELGDEQRRELLARLDHEPDGWRRCALAFLEDQALRQALEPTDPAVIRPKSLLDTDKLVTQFLDSFQLLK